MRPFDALLHRKSVLGVSKVVGFLFAALALTACDLFDKKAADCSTPPNGLSFTNYDGVKSDATVFALDTLVAKLGDTLDVTGQVSGPLFGQLYIFPYEGATDGLVTLELFKDSVTKAAVTLELTAKTGSGCSAVITQRNYSVVWLETTGHAGFTDVEVTEEP